MKWVRFTTSSGTVFGLLRENRVYPTTATWAGVVEGTPPVETGAVIDLDDLELDIPMDRPGKVVAIGQNYMDHCREQNVSPPASPLIFCKFTSAVIGPGDTIRWSSTLTNQVDLEAELAVVIGRKARNVPESEGLNFVLGYTCANDISARDLQFGDKQWVRGKSLDTFCPLGPVLVTCDEIRDPQSLSIRAERNGQVMQNSSTAEMIFGVASLVSYCSRSFTLEPGDVLLTGTPHGVGVFRDPPVFLQGGDRVAVEIEGIGRLENRCEVE